MGEDRDLAEGDFARLEIREFRHAFRLLRLGDRLAPKGGQDKAASVAQIVEGPAWAGGRSRNGAVEGDADMDAVLPHHAGAPA